MAIVQARCKCLTCYVRRADREGIINKDSITEAKINSMSKWMTRQEPQ